MNITLKRTNLQPTYTEGQLFIDDKYFCDTIEDTFRKLPIICPNKNDCKCKEKIYSQTAIPVGVYKFILSLSNRFKKILPEILNVPHFLGIRIHSGNKAEDSAGCILLGIKSKDGEVLQSRIIMDKFLLLIKDKKDLTIIIK